MKFQRMIVCAGCSEVREWNIDTCPDCGDRAAFSPAGILDQRAATREIENALDQISAVRARA